MDFHDFETRHKVHEDVKCAQQVMSKQAADEALDSVREEQYHRPQPSHESTSQHPARITCSARSCSATNGLRAEVHLNKSFGL